LDVYRIGYRLYATSPLDGEGSFLYGGRWSSTGTRMAYTSTTLTLAMAEFLAHVHIEDFDARTPPELVYVRATVPDEAVMMLEDVGSSLPAAWDEVPAPAVDAVLGDAWIRSARSLGLVVPSVHVPIETPERNVLINPMHRDFARVSYDVHPFAYDRRLLIASAPPASPRRKREPKQ
jgi:RES domain-containing protein